jgi:hypothetical protein
MRIGVYNAYWSTFGGGEQQAGGVVDALSADHDVEMLGPEAFDLGRARERLGLRLDGVSFRTVAGDQLNAALASTDYDLFINHTYRSTAPSLAKQGIYFVMFPHPLDGTAKGRAARKVAGRYASPVRLLGGIHHRHGHDHLVGPVQVQVAEGVQQVEIEFTARHPDTVLIAEAAPLAPVTSHLVHGVATLSLPAGARNVIISPSVLGDDLDIVEAMCVTGVRADGRPVTSSPAAMAQRLAAVRTNEFIDTYDRFVSLSEYTRRWTHRWWGRDSSVISPPVNLRSPGPKERLIVSVGRFFDERSGHSKRQLELVAAFRTMVEQGLEGWRLVLIGGCNPDNREYAMQVRAAAEGLPIEVRISAPGAVVDANFAAASIYWHAAGYGSDLEAHPDRAEHFGIAPIEAMSAGAVPVVFDAAGPAEVVHPGVNGLVFHTLDELVGHTRRLIDDHELRERLAASAIESAQHYRRARFEDDVRDLVRGVTTG